MDGRAVRRNLVTGIVATAFCGAISQTAQAFPVVEAVGLASAIYGFLSKPDFWAGADDGAIEQLGATLLDVSRQISQMRDEINETDFRARRTIIISEVINCANATEDVRYWRFQPSSAVRNEALQRANITTRKALQSLLDPMYHQNVDGTESRRRLDVLVPALTSIGNAYALTRAFDPVRQYSQPEVLVQARDHLLQLASPWTPSMMAFPQGGWLYSAVKNDCIVVGRKMPDLDNYCLNHFECHHTGTSLPDSSWVPEYGQRGYFYDHSNWPNCSSMPISAWQHEPINEHWTGWYNRFAPEAFEALEMHINAFVEKHYVPPWDKVNGLANVWTQMAQLSPVVPYPTGSGQPHYPGSGGGSRFPGPLSF